jgi:hypothetical protein
MHVNTTLFMLNRSYIFQPSKGHPQGVLIHFISQVKNYICPDVNDRLKSSALYVT